MKDVLVESKEKEGAVLAQRAANGESKLVLLADGLEVEGEVASVERTVAQIVERCSVIFVGARFGDDVDDGPARASGFG